jgi:hypothetical protein
MVGLADEVPSSMISELMFLFSDPQNLLLPSTAPPLGRSISTLPGATPLVHHRSNIWCHNSLQHGTRVEVLGAIPPATQFFDTCIPPLLASVEPAGSTTPEQEQAAPTATARM